MKRALPALLACICVVACGDDSSDADHDAALSQIDAANTEPDAAEEPRVGFELLQIIAPDEIVVWITADLSQAEFDAIDLLPGWIKNQPREGEPDSSSFARSPDAAMDGEFTTEEHYGHDWLHNATVIEANTLLDKQGLLRLNRVAKFHEVRFNAGRTLVVLISPEGEQYVRISRDAGRTTDDPTIPQPWQLVEHVITEELIIQLPNPTLNIRVDNEDSFQGPIPPLNISASASRR